MQLPVKCPTCDDSLVTLWFQQCDEVNGKKVGRRIKSGLFFCRKCNIPIQIVAKRALTMVIKK